MALMSGSSKGYGHNNRGKAYGLLLLLAFGAAVFGFMLLHKLRERRVFALLLKEKDRELLSLQFLVEKEKVTVKEVKRKMEEMKTKLNSFRNQKAELNRRMGDMHSMIASLKQEHRALELALEKQQNENKILREKGISSDKVNTEIVSLRELLKQKEEEIKEMKQSIEKPTKIWSASADDPSNTPVNLTTTGTTVGESGKVNLAAEYQKLQELNVKDGQNSRSERETENETRTAGRNQTEIPREEQLQTGYTNPVGENISQRGASVQDPTQRGDNGENNADNHQGEGEFGGNGESKKPKVPQEDRHDESTNQTNRNQGNIDEKSHDGESLKTGDAVVVEDNHGAIINGEIQKPKNPAEVVDENHGAITNGEIQEAKNPQESDGQGHSKGEMKLEVHTDVSHIDSISRRRGGSRSKKGHRRRQMIFRDGELEKSGSSKQALGDEHGQDNAVVREGQGDGHSEMHDKPKNEVLGITTNKNQAALEGEEGAVSDTRKLEMPTNTGVVEGSVEKHRLREASDGELQKSYNTQHDEDSESASPANQVAKEQEVSHLKPQVSEDGEGLTTDSIKSKASQLADDAFEQKMDVERRQEDQEAIEQKLDAEGQQEDQEVGAIENLEVGGTTGKGSRKDVKDEEENMEVDSAGEQTGKTTETEDEIHGNLDLELDDIEGHHREGDTDEEEF